MTPRKSEVPPDRWQRILDQAKKDRAKRPQRRDCVPPEIWEKRLARVRELRSLNPKKRQEIEKRSQLKRNDSYLRSARQRRENGWSEERYRQFLADQKGVCCVCKREVGDKKLCADHNHSTGQPRALLCVRCNSWLGYIEKTPELIEALKQYLEHWKAG